jgi:ribosome modulation factor
VDYFVSGGKPWAREVNATIPAMQGYSDIAARTFIEVVGRYFRYPEKALPTLLSLNGSNALALYRALLDGYAAERNGKMPDTVALLCRRNDAQITELRWLCERFREYGADADVVHPDEVSGDDAFEVRGKKYDLVYRHLFVRRLEETPSPWVEDFVGTVPGKKAVFLNPPASQVEVKSTFARLSQALSEPSLAEAAGLTADELEAVRASVPWTRVFRPGPAVGPDGGRTEDLVALVAADPKRYVLKRAWDYGGKAVFLGRSEGTVPYTERVKAAYGELLGWPELCARAAADPAGGGFVVQEVVDSPPEDHLLCEPTGTVLPASFFVDYSAYASVGLARQPAWGGVCRGSMSEIVNIVGGGGVLPLITSEVASKLLLAWKAI